MQSKIPLYPYGAKEARERGEIEKWRESFRENCACAGGIDILIRESFDGMHLKKGTVEKIVELYGYKRVEHVLANTVQERRGDGRFRPDNRAWAESHYIPEDEMHILAFRRSNPLSQRAGATYDELIMTNYDPRPYIQPQFSMFPAEIENGDLVLVHEPTCGSLREIYRRKSVFPTDDSLLKMLYLTMMDITKKWTGRRQDWSVIHAQLAVFFADRMPD